MDAAGLFAALAPNAPATGDRALAPEGQGADGAGFADALMAMLAGAMGVQQPLLQPQPEAAQGESAEGEEALAASSATTAPASKGWMEAALTGAQAATDEIPGATVAANAATSEPDPTAVLPTTTDTLVADVAGQPQAATPKDAAKDAAKALLGQLLKQASTDAASDAPPPGAPQPKAQPDADVVAQAAPAPPAPAAVSIPMSEPVTVIAAQIAGPPPPPRAETAPHAKARDGEGKKAESVLDASTDVTAAPVAPQDGEALAAAADKPHAKPEGFDLAAKDAKTDDAPALQAADPTSRPDAPPPADITAKNHAPADVKATPQTVAALATQIAEKVSAKTTRFDIQLDPMGLGKVDVRVEINAAGALSAALHFENPQAAQELRSRASELHAALQQAGFDLTKTSLHFTGGGADQQSGQSAWNQQQQQQSQQQATAPWDRRSFVDLADNPEARTPAASRYARPSGVDVTV